MKTGRRQFREERLAAFEAAAARYEGPLLRYAARLCRDPDAAQDIVQESFIKLFKNWNEEFSASPALSSWLYRVTHNCAVDYMRKQARRHLLHSRQAGEQRHFTPPDRGEWFRISEQAEQAARALDALSLRERQLVVLKVYEEKSYREISEITGLSTGNVGYILHHAMKKLAASLKKENVI